MSLNAQNKEHINKGFVASGYDVVSYFDGKPTKGKKKFTQSKILTDTSERLRLKMKVGDLVYPFLKRYNDKTIGIIVDLFHNRCSVYGVLINGAIHVVPIMHITSVR